MAGRAATRSVILVFPGWEEAWNGEEMARHGFESVVRAVSDVAALIEVEDTGTLVFPARGPSRYFGGDRALAARLHALVAGLEETATARTGWGVGIAGSRFAAAAAARMAHTAGSPRVVEDKDTGGFLASLPVAALARVGEVDPGVVDLFGRLGLRTCGAVAALGEPALVDRFGEQGRRVHVLVSGGDVRIFDPAAVPRDHTAIVTFEDPVDDAMIVATAVRSAAEDLVARVAAHARQCVRLLITCERDDGARTSRIWTETRGFGAAGIVSRVVAQMTGASGGDAAPWGVTALEVAALECRAHLAVQPLLWGGRRENSERAARAASLAAAVDPRVEVSVPRWEGGRDPARVYSRVPVGHVDLADEEAALRRVERGEGVPREWSGSLPRPVPARVLTRALAAELLGEGGVPVQVTARHELVPEPVLLRAGAFCWEVLRRAGPWPVEERWWDARRRRHVRLQLLVRDTRGSTGVLLVGLEDGAWSLLARHD